MALAIGSVVGRHGLLAADADADGEAPLPETLPAVRHVASTPDGATAVAVHWHRVASVWRGAERTAARRIPCELLCSAAIEGDGREAVLFGLKREPRRTDVMRRSIDDLREIETAAPRSVDRTKAEIDEFARPGLGPILTADGKSVAALGENGRLLVFDLASPSERASVRLDFDAWRLLRVDGRVAPAGLCVDSTGAVARFDADGKRVWSVALAATVPGETATPPSGKDAWYIAACAPDPTFTNVVVRVRADVDGPFSGRSDVVALDWKTGKERWRAVISPEDVVALGGNLGAWAVVSQRGDVVTAVVRSAETGEQIGSAETRTQELVQTATLAPAAWRIWFGTLGGTVESAHIRRRDGTRSPAGSATRGAGDGTGT